MPDMPLTHVEWENLFSFYTEEKLAEWWVSFNGFEWPNNFPIAEPLEYASAKKRLGWGAYRSTPYHLPFKVLTEMLPASLLNSTWRRIKEKSFFEELDLRNKNR
jgi:hypothetical protein